MIKIYSKGCEYALRILAQIPRDDFNQKFLAVDLCRKANVPISSARKILQLLVEHEYLDAVPGPRGGYKLRKDPSAVSLLDVIRTIDGRNTFERCVMGLSQCDEKNPCPLHTLWKKIKVEMKKEMSRKTLAQLMAVMGGERR